MNKPTVIVALCLLFFLIGCQNAKRSAPELEQSAFGTSAVLGSSQAYWGDSIDVTFSLGNETLSQATVLIKGTSVEAQVRPSNKASFIVDSDIIVGERTVGIVTSTLEGSFDYHTAKLEVLGERTKPGISLDKESAAYGESIIVTLQGNTRFTERFTISIDGISTTDLERLNDRQMRMTIPNTVKSGSTTLSFSNRGARELTTFLEVLDPTDFISTDQTSAEFLALVVNGRTRADIETRLRELTGELVLSSPLQLISFEQLGASEGACSQAQVRISVPDITKFGAVRSALKADFDYFSAIDPGTSWSNGQAQATDYAATLGLANARRRGLDGRGTTIAILDTGITPTADLENRIGFSFDATGEDDASDVEAHGTPIALLAAGTQAGIASKASVANVRVCDGDGECRLDHIVKGMCAVVDEPSIDKSKLILNLSLNGKYTSNIVEGILEDMTEEGTLVAIAAGNDAEAGSPRQYPAAYAKDMAGVVAVGALSTAETTPNFWVSIDDQPANPWDTPSGTAMTWTVKKTKVEAGKTYQLMGNTNGGAPLVEAAVTEARSILCVSEEKVLPEPQFVSLEPTTDNTSRHWSGRQALLTPPVVGSSLTSLAVADAMCEQEAQKQGLRGFEMAEFHDKTPGVGWKYWLPVPLVTDVQAATFSNRGDYVELSAPGDGLNVDNTYTELSGTSYATPLVGGAMALWRQKYPTWTPAQIEEAMKDSAKALPGLDSKAVGVGMLDLSGTF